MKDGVFWWVSASVRFGAGVFFGCGVIAVAAVVAAAAAAAAAGAVAAWTVVVAAGVVVVVDTRGLDFRGFLESVDSSERFVCVFCNGAVVDLGEFYVTFGVAFA